MNHDNTILKDSFINTSTPTNTHHHHHQEDEEFYNNEPLANSGASSALELMRIRGVCECVFVC